MAKAGKRSPAMEQFFRAKQQYPDAILFFRMGDFYEMFYEDAVLAVDAARPHADLARQRRATACRFPMAGVPHHAAAGYIARLLEQGQRSRSASRWPTPRRSRASCRARWCA